MKIKISLWLLALASIGYFMDGARACSTFILKNDGRQVFGRNYDWGVWTMPF